MASLLGIPMNQFSEVWRYAALLLTVISGSQSSHSSSCLMAQTKEYRVATFAADVTPPQGNPLCGGLVKPVAGVSEPLQALGIVLFGSEQPIVLCAVDWCEIHNRDHVVWRERLAVAAGTTPDRVAVQCLHQHNAPIADSAAEEFLSWAPSPVKVQDNVWMQKAVAGYGDGGCGYIPLQSSFAEGGYEPTWAFAAPANEKTIRQTMNELIAQ